MPTISYPNSKKSSPTSKPMLQSTLAPIIVALNLLFSIFNENFFDSALSKAVITLSEKGARKVVGWCTREEVWEDGSKNRYFEINICPDYLNQPFEDICEVLLHEMCHLYNALNGIKDCSRNSQYHNRNFRVCAETHGLRVEKTSSRGFARTYLEPETKKFIKTLDSSGFDLFRNPIKKAKDEQKTTSTRKYCCPGCGLSLRATKDIRVICENCGKRLIKQV